MATFVNDLRLTELATGEGSGTWGTTTNTNLELVAEAFSFGTEAITTNADTHTTTIADGSTDPGRSIFLKYTGTLDSACTITIGPNTVSKLWFIENATSGSQNIIVSQGSGANITIPNGQTKAIYSDGAGSGAAMVDAFQDLSIPDLFIDDDLTIGDDLTFTSDSAVITFGADGDTTLTHTDGSGLTLNSTNKIMFNDASQFIQGSSATVLSLGATDEIDLTATLIDINGNADVSGTVTATGTSVFASLDISGDIDVDGTTNLDVVDIDGAVDMASTLSVANTVQITDASLDIFTSSASAVVGKVSNTANDINIFSTTSGHNGLRFHVDGILPTDNSGTIVDDDASLGDPSYRFKNLYLSGVANIDGGAVFNEDSADVDFRVESNGNTHMLFVDAGNDLVGIGQSSPASYNGSFNDLVVGASSATGITVVSGTTAAGTLAFADGTSGDAAYRGFVQYNHNTDALALGSAGVTSLTLDTNNDATFAAQLTIPEKIIHTGDADTFLQFNAADTFRIVAGDEERFRVATGEVVVNESSQDTDFRVEGNGNANLLFVDAGSDHVNIGSSVDFGGVANIVSSDNGNTLVLVSTDTDANEGPILSLYRASASSAADGDVLGQINFQGLNDANQAVTYALIENRIVDASDGTEDGRIEIATILAGTAGVSRVLMDATETVFNDNSKDLDFRVESDGNANMLFVDAGSNFVGINTSSPNAPLHVQTSHTQTNVTLANDNDTLNIANSGSGDGVFNAIKFSGNQQDMYMMSINDSAQADRRLGFFVGSVAGDATGDEHLAVKGSGAVVFSADNAVTKVTLTGNKASVADNTATSFAKLTANNNEVHGHLTLRYNLEDPGQNIGVGVKTFRVFYNGGTTLLDAIQSDTTVFDPTITATASGAEFTLKVTFNSTNSTYVFDYDLEFVAHNTQVAVGNIEEL